MSKILISYRREDSADVTGRIYDRLIKVFPQSVFRDVDSIPLGVDFRAYLDEQVAKCNMFLAVIGLDWLRGKGRKGKSRLEDPGDFVRIEIESALKRQIPVIPVLVGGAKIPPAERLPSSIEDLSYRNGLVVRPDPDFHKDMDRLIIHLKRQVSAQSETNAESDTRTILISKDKKQVAETQLTAGPDSLTKRERELIRLRRQGLSNKDIAQMMSISDSTVRHHVTSILNKGIHPTFPEDMVRVPKGPLLYGKEKFCEVIDHDYWIDKYTVTNEMYRAFIEAGGYENQRYWSFNGWKWRIGTNITAPEYWDDTKWNKPDCPVVGVSFYEAEAYSTWAGKRLPTEREWEKAARGEDGRQYPWGEEFDMDRCNSSESRMEQPTPVTLYPNGVSPYGCHDMAGNVFEWCDDWYDKNAGERVIRGGSWFYDRSFQCLSSRLGHVAAYRNYLIGFRLVLDMP